VSTDGGFPTMWTVCELCGGVVADDSLHAIWHATLTTRVTERPS